jgi:phospholipid N-methyltransferase
MSTLSYIKNFIKDRDVAAITPSSSFLVKRVCRWIDFTAPNVVVEYGPGTGVFTEHIVDEMTDDSKLILIEGNEAFVEKLQQRFGSDERVEVVHGRAEDVEAILDAAGETAADYVISGIPFSFLDDDVKDELIECTREILTDEGKFLVYQNYNHMEKPLRRHFGHVHKEYEIFNIPPMFAYQAAK